MTDRSACVRVPAHITGLFSAHEAADPRMAGSRGAGITLEDGVSVTVRPGTEPSLRVDGQPTTIAPASTVIERLGVTPEITVRSAVPMGAGFGVSGAVALGVAFGCTIAYDLRMTENELVSLAHEAEVHAGTGLGDVVAQHRGGVPIRLVPGAPGHGVLDGIPVRGDIEYYSLGELSTEAILAGDMVAINRAGEHALNALLEQPSLERLVGVSREFARESGLLPDALETIIEDVEAAGGLAAMAMLGQTVFALDRGLSDAGYDASRTAISGRGVTIEHRSNTG